MIDALERALASFDLPRSIVAEALAACEACAEAWKRRDAGALAVTAKVTHAFASAGLTDAHLTGSTGYGYHDFGREAFESILAAVMDAQSALARVQLVSGTQAIVASIAALGGSDGTICSLTGRPYDTLRLALVDHPRALRPHGVGYEEVAWSPAPALDETAVAAAVRRRPAVVFVQRSRGYAARQSASIADIRRLVEIVKRAHPPAPVIVDNCYGEFVEPLEPCAVGADIVVGSLIKNPGAGMAVTGAYIAGSSDLLERIAERIFAPGLGRGVGPSLDAMRFFYAGLHRAPRTVAESL